VPNQRVRGVEDVAVRPVVLSSLMPHRSTAGEVALEMLHVRRVRPERVDRLVVVADGEHRGVGPGEKPQPLVLEQVGVLELVDEQVREAALVVVADRIVLRQSS
jgi:hypothetical protein